MVTCQFCGNDDGAYQICLDCMGTTVEALENALAAVVGGTPEKWHDIATDVHARLT